MLREQQRRAGIAESRLEGFVGAATGSAGAGLPGAGGAATAGAVASDARGLLPAGTGGACASGAAPMAPGAVSYAAALRSGGLPGCRGGARAAPKRPRLLPDADGPDDHACEGCRAPP
ncbi:Golgi-associated RAB2B interactor protein 3-like [Dermacentor albipictus]|uniref:Golgi-associated RAB2B interactor protein 3-like n=1 Tax=Dermacentor albipictus TaxID=60249 RepID=UPI0038FC4EDB